MRSKVFATLIALSCGFVFQANQASAAVITETVNYGMPIPITIPPVPALNLTLHKFDSDLGVLTSIQFVFNSTMTLSANVINQEAVDAVVSNVVSSATLTVTAFNNLNTSVNGSVGPFAGIVAASSSATLGTSTTPTLSSTANVAAADFGLYSAPGGGGISYDVTLSGLASASGNSNNFNTFFGTQGSAVGSVEVIYTYSAVPEPGPLALAAIGLLPVGLAGVRRLRSRVNA